MGESFPVYRWKGHRGYKEMEEEEIVECEDIKLNIITYSQTYVKDHLPHKDQHVNRGHHTD